MPGVMKAGGEENLPLYWTRWHDAAIAMILSGAIGNVTDRIYLGMFGTGAAVRDFIKVNITTTLMPDTGGWWPTFNVADMFICVGVGLYIFLFFVEWRVVTKAEAALKDGKASEA